jgi:hypothetical protein
LNPTDGIADLGFVDLNTGRLHPKHEKPGLAPDLWTRGVLFTRLPGW